jgi:hypothetical protein
VKGSAAAYLDINREKVLMLPVRKNGRVLK